MLTNTTGVARLNGCMSKLDNVHTVRRVVMHQILLRSVRLRLSARLSLDVEIGRARTTFLKVPSQLFFKLASAFNEPHCCLWLSELPVIRNLNHQGNAVCGLNGVPDMYARSA